MISKADIYALMSKEIDLYKSDYLEPDGELFLEIVNSAQRSLVRLLIDPVGVLGKENMNAFIESNSTLAEDISEVIATVQKTVAAGVPVTEAQINTLLGTGKQMAFVRMISAKPSGKACPYVPMAFQSAQLNAMSSILRFGKGQYRYTVDSTGYRLYPEKNFDAQFVVCRWPVEVTITQDCEFGDRVKERLIIMCCMQYCQSIRDYAMVNTLTQKLVNLP